MRVLRDPWRGSEVVTISQRGPIFGAPRGDLSPWSVVGAEEKRSGERRANLTSLTSLTSLLGTAPGKDHFAKQGGGCFKRWKGVWHVRPRCTPSSRRSPPFGLLKMGVKKGTAGAKPEQTLQAGRA